MLLVIPSSDPESDDDSLGYVKQEIINNSSSEIKYGFANKVQEIGQHLRVLLFVIDK